MPPGLAQSAYYIGLSLIHILQITNAKLVGRGTRMIAEAAGIGEEQARELLLRWGSVKEALGQDVYKRQVFNTIQIRLGLALGKPGLVESDFFRISNSTRLRCV